MLFLRVCRRDVSASSPSQGRAVRSNPELPAQSWFGLWGPLAPAALFSIQAGSGSGFVASELPVWLVEGWISVCGITIG